jgi:hypothetical protein
MKIIDIYKWSIWRGFIVIAILFFLNWIGVLFHIYSTLWWWDTLTHMLGGIVVGFLAYALCARYSIYADIDDKESWIIWFLLVLCVAVGWELYEVIVSQILLDGVFSVIDTLHDVMNDLLGGLVSYYWIVRFLLMA